MPNEVYNYVRISGANEELKNHFLTVPFAPESYFQEPQPNGRDDSVLLEWRRVGFGSERFYDNGSLTRRPQLSYSNGYIQGFFQTSWTAPIQFYEVLKEKYPQITIYYEYTDFYMGFCGYGSVPGEPTQLVWNNPEELATIKQSYNWYMAPWDPHFDFAAAAAQQIT